MSSVFKRKYQNFTLPHVKGRGGVRPHADMDVGIREKYTDVELRPNFNSVLLQIAYSPHIFSPKGDQQKPC